MRACLVIALVLATADAAAASFDCAKAATPVEKSICSDQQLSRLDDQLAGAFQTALQDPVNAELIRKHQREWLANERNKCQTSACIVKAYDRRLEQLSTRSAVAPALGKALVEWAKPDPLPAYRYALHDLNDDGKPDAIVLLTGSQYCGSGGCMMVILEGSTTGFRVVSHTTITRDPILVLAEARHGWHTVAVSVSGGGGESGQAMLRFDGKVYPLNPSTQPLVPSSVAKSASTHLLDLQ